jgi:uncharacterized protein
MSWDTARRAIDIFFSQAAGPTSLVPEICFFGGEPLLEFDLITQCIAYAESLRQSSGMNFGLTLTTNGLLLDRSKAEYFREKGVDIVVSFDGVKEAQDATRPFGDGRSSFAQSLKGVNTAIDTFENPCICMVVSPENVEYLPQSFDLVLEQGAEKMMLNPNFFAKWSQSDRGLWRAGYSHAADRVEEAYRKGIALNVNLFTAKIITHLKGGYDEGDCCLFGQNEIAVSPGGNIYPCQRMVGQDEKTLGLLGNVFDGLDMTAMNGLAGCRAVRNDACDKCDFRGRCRNWCSCVNYALTGQFGQPGDIICFHEQMVIPLADRVASRLFAECSKTFMDTFYFQKHLAAEWI